MMIGRESRFLCSTIRVILALEIKYHVLDEKNAKEMHEKVERIL